jgi:hypothetical protein
MGPGSATPDGKAQIAAYLRRNGLPVTGSFGVDLSRAQEHRETNVALQDPRVQQLIQSGGAGWVSKIPGTRDTDVKIENGRIVGMRSGGLWKPLMAAAGVAGGGMAAGALLPGAGAVSGSAGPVAAGGGTTSAAVPASLAAGGAGSLFKDIAQLAAPLAGPIAGMVAGRNRGTSAPEAQMGEMLELMQQRMARTTPVHEAAMRMAMSMAPTGNNSPRMAQAIQNTNRPMAQTPINPQVSEAIQRLMGNR